MKTGLSLLRSFLSSNTGATKSKKIQRPRVIGEAKISRFDNDRSANKYLFFEYENPIDYTGQNCPSYIGAKKKTIYRSLRDFFTPFHKQAERFFNRLNRSFGDGNVFEVIKEMAADAFEQEAIDKKSLRQMIFITAKYDEKLVKLTKKINEQEFNKPGSTLMVLVNSPDNEKEKTLMKEKLEKLKEYIDTQKPNLNICLFSVPIKGWRFGAKGLVYTIGLFLAKLLKVRKNFVLNMFDGDITNFISNKVIDNKYHIAKGYDALLLGDCAEDIGEVFKKDPYVALDLYFHQMYLDKFHYPIGANMACKASTYMNSGGLPLGVGGGEDSFFIDAVKKSGREKILAGHCSEDLTVYCDGDVALYDYQSGNFYGNDYIYGKRHQANSKRNFFKDLNPDFQLNESIFELLLRKKCKRRYSEETSMKKVEELMPKIKEDLGIDIIVHELDDSKSDDFELEFKYEGTIKDRLENYIKQNFSE